MVSLKIKIYLIVIVLLISTLTSTSKSYAEDCSAPNLDYLFYDDYYKGTKWSKKGKTKTIEWTISSSSSGGEGKTKEFTSEEVKWIDKAIKSWDIALDSISFRQVTKENADLTIAYTKLSGIPENIYGYWNAKWDKNNIRYEASIRLRDNAEFLKTKNGFIHGLQHELGNVLGLGDIQPNQDFNSPQEDPWQEPYGQIPLSDFNYKIIRKLYNESTCPTHFNKDLNAVKTTPIINCKSFTSKNENLLEKIYLAPIHLLQIVTKSNGSKLLTDKYCIHNHSNAILPAIIYSTIIILLIIK